MFQIAIFVKNCKFRMKCVEKYMMGALLARPVNVGYAN